MKFTSRLAINFTAKPKKNVSFAKNNDNHWDDDVEAANLIDFCDNGDDSKIVANIPNSTVLSENVSCNGTNPFKLKNKKPFDLEYFKWNSEASQSVAMAKNAHDYNDGSMMMTLSTSSEADAMNGAVNAYVPVVEPHMFDIDDLYFVYCRKCNNKIVSSSWSEHMRRIHNEDVDPDCVPDCKNANMKAVLCEKCRNIMPRSALASHMDRKHRADEMIGTIMVNGPNDNAFNNMLKNGKIFAKGGIIFYKVE